LYQRVEAEKKERRAKFIRNLNPMNWTVSWCPKAAAAEALLPKTVKLELSAMHCRSVDVEKDSPRTWEPCAEELHSRCVARADGVFQCRCNPHAVGCLRCLPSEKEVRQALLKADGHSENALELLKALKLHPERLATREQLVQYVMAKISERTQSSGNSRISAPIGMSQAAAEVFPAGGLAEKRSWRTQSRATACLGVLLRGQSGYAHRHEDEWKKRELQVRAALESVNWNLWNLGRVAETVYDMEAAEERRLQDEKEDRRLEAIAKAIGEIALPAPAREMLLKLSPEGFGLLADARNLRFPVKRWRHGGQSGTTASGTPWNYTFTATWKHIFKKEFQLGALRITQEAGTGSAQAIGIMTNRVNRRLVSYTVSYGDEVIFLAIEDGWSTPSAGTRSRKAKLVQGSEEAALGAIRLAAGLENVHYQDLLRLLPVELPFGGTPSVKKKCEA